MEFSHLLMLLASWLICLTTVIASPASYYPSLGSFDDIDADNYYAPYAEPINDFRLSRLQRGYYYINNGYITAVPKSVLPTGRRLDSDSSLSAEERQDRYAQLLHYKKEHAKRKKLFVPNLYG